MSLETWKAEFYPESASNVPKKRAVEHSLRKWRGLTKANLNRHELTVSAFGEICDGGSSLPIDDSSCALCWHYLLDEKCCGCPIYESRSGITCYELKGRELRSPYSHFTRKLNPHPMIKALELAQDWERRQKEDR